MRQKLIYFFNMTPLDNLFFSTCISVAWNFVIANGFFCYFHRCSLLDEEKSFFLITIDKLRCFLELIYDIAQGIPVKNVT